MLRPSSQRVFVDTVEGVTVVTLAHARIVADDVLAEVGEILDIIDGPDLSRVLVNFREVRVMSSALLAALMRLSRRVASVGGRLKLCCIDPDLMTVFKITCFDRFFDIRAEECSALDSF